MTTQRPRIAYWSPLPPQRSGIADYSVELLAQLEQWYDLELFIDNYTPAPSLQARYAIYSYTRYAERHAVQPFDLNVYQLGNAPLHSYQLAQIYSVPGLVVLHDLAMGHLYYRNALRTGNIQAFLAETAYAEGQQGVDDFIFSVSGQDASSPYYWQYFSKHLYLKRIIENSLAQIVHFDLGVELIKQRYGGNPHLVYQGVDDPHGWHTPSELDDLRQQLGITSQTFVVGAMGRVSPQKQVDVIIRAFAQLKAQVTDTKLLIIGPQTNEAYKAHLHALVQEYQLAPDVIIQDNVPDLRDFLKYQMIQDVSIVLRRNSALQMSAVLVRALSAGKALICSDLPEWRFLPDDACYRVDPADEQGLYIADHLLLLARDPTLCRQRGENAYRFYTQHCTEPIAARKVADCIDAVLRQVHAQAPVPPNLPTEKQPVTAPDQEYIALIQADLARKEWETLYNSKNTRAGDLGWRRWPLLGALYPHLARWRRLGRVGAQQARLPAGKYAALHDLYRQVVTVQTHLTALHRGAVTPQMNTGLPPLYVEDIDGTTANAYDASYMEQVLAALSYRAKPVDSVRHIYAAYRQVVNGDPSTVKQRLTNYLPYLSTLASERYPILDLAYGRGEFLEVARDHQLPSVGVTKDSEMAAHLVAAELDARAQVSIDYLTSLPDASLSGVVACQVGDPLERAYLHTILPLLLKKLIAGGKVLLEVPNPLNLTVLSQIYHDPPQPHPISPALLAHMFKVHGFKPQKIVFTSPISGTVNRQGIRSHYWYYAMLAQSTSSNP